MSVNSSSAGASQIPFDFSISSVDCLNPRESMLILTMFSMTNIFLTVPLSTLVLYLGYQRRRQPRSISSHSDIFTYHMVVMEMFAILGSLLYCVGVYANLLEIKSSGFDFFFCLWSIKILFHALTCVERYLAVVHPVTYLGLKNKGGVRFRNSSIGCVWLMCLVWMALIFTRCAATLGFYFSLLAFATTVVCFCCISVLLALKRPGPGEMGNDRERVDQMKRRAFNTVVTITGVLLFWFGGMLVCNAVLYSYVLSVSDGCAVLSSGVCFSLPGSLILPLLYLHRAGKLPGCRP